VVAFRRWMLRYKITPDEVRVMNRVQRFFRYVWRINAVLILIAAGAITLVVGSYLVQEFYTNKVQRSRNNEEAGVPVGHSDEMAELSLTRAAALEGTSVMRAQLVRNGEGAKFGSSGDTTEIRNILFIEPGDKSARWLLPDNDHVIDESLDAERDTGKKQTVATAVLVKPLAGGRGPDTGRLLLFDLPGRRIVEVANEVQEIQVASFTGDELTILYKRDRRLVLATFDPATFAKHREQPVDVPQLN